MTHPCDLYPVRIPTEEEYAEFRRAQVIWEQAKAALNVRSDQDVMPALRALVRKVKTS